MHGHALVELPTPVRPAHVLAPSLDHAPQELRLAVAQTHAGVLLPPPLLDLGRVDVALAGAVGVSSFNLLHAERREAGGF